MVLGRRRLLPAAVVSCVSISNVTHNSNVRLEGRQESSSLIVFRF